MEIFKKKKLQFYLLIIILFIGSFLRVYNFPYRYSLGEETIRDAVIGIEGARQLQFPLTGSFSSLGPFTFGPWYAYQLIFFHLLVPFVYSPWIYLTIISILYIFILYKIGFLLGKERFGLIIAFIAAISPAQIISATHLTSHNNTNIFAALAIWIFLRLIFNKLSYWWGFILGLVIGIGMNLHFQMAGLLILLMILLIYKGRKYFYFVSSFFGLFTSFIPLLFFELNNHWFTTRNMINYLLYEKNNVYVPNRWLFYLRDFWPSFWGDALGIPSLAAGVLIALFLIFLVLAYSKKRLSKEMLLIFIAFLFNFILLRYYWGPRFFGYLNYLRPFIFIFTTFTLIYIGSLIKHKLITPLLYVVLLGMLVFFSSSRIVSGLQQDSFTMKMYKQVSAIEEKYKNKDFSLYSCSLKYSSSYNAYVFSTVFLLELKHKYNPKSPIKLGINSTCDYPSKPMIDNNNIGEIISFNDIPENTLVKKGWNKISFSDIYDSYARWWFRLQP